MSVRQYIGARYVTKVYENSLDPSSAEWESGVTYEPLTLVTYLNSSYLSKKEVPGSVGNPAANPTYWVVTGAYNGQIAQIQSDISDINTAIDAIRKKNIVLIGDSYGTADGAYPGTPTITDTLPEVIKAYLKADNDHFHYNYVNGAGFANDGYLNALQAIESSLDDTVTDIYVMGGWNDETTRPGLDANVVDAGMTAFKTYTSTQYPNATVHVLFIASGAYEDVQTNAPGDGYYSTGLHETWELYSLAGRKGMAYHNDAAYVLHNSAFVQQEGIHPNQLGVMELGKAVTSIILGNTADYQYYAVTRGSDFGAVTGTTNNCAVNQTVLFEQATAKGIHLDFYTESGVTMITYSTATSISLDGRAIDILTRMPKMSLGYLKFLTIKIEVSIIDDNNVITNLTADLAITPKTIKLILPYVPQASLLPETITAKHILIGRGTTDTNDLLGI